MNASLLLRMAAEGMAERIVLGAGGEGYSGGSLLAHAAAAAEWIGRRPARHLVYLGLNAPAFPLAFFASALAGRIFVPLNYRLPDADLGRLLARTAPALVIADEEFLPRLPELPGIEVVSRGAFLQASDGPGAEGGEAPSEEIALILFTSGTTGEPKAAILRHQHLTSYVVQTVDFAAAGEDEALLVSVPPYHIAGVAALLTSIYAGRRIVQLPAFSPEDWVVLARRERISHAMVVPTMLGRILDELQRSGVTLPALRHLSYGGGRMPVAVIERALALLPQVDFINAYGLTETSSTIAVLDAADHRRAGDGDALARRRLGSVGRPLPGIELEIRGMDEALLPAGVPGEIWVRGAQVSGEYVGRKRIRDDGWLPTNDCGWLDEGGYLYVDGRLDDVIVRGGENISPGEIEELLRSHPGVRDAAVIGLPDEDWGERIAAVVVAEPPADAATLQAWVRQRLRSTKVPEEIHFRSELPYNDTGKLLRRVLKKELAEGAKASA